MIVDFSSLTPNARYHCMTQTLIPRPIAWVLSENPAGDFNLAPFSYFTAVSSQPPLVMISVGRKPDGSFKDTRVNIERTGRFVIHIASAQHAPDVTESSRTLSLGDSEVSRIGLDISEFAGFPLPRLSDPVIAMGCMLYEIQELGPVPQSLIFGEVQQVYLSDDVAYEQDGRLKVDGAKVNPLARLGGGEYATQGDVFTIKRPD